LLNSFTKARIVIADDGSGDEIKKMIIDFSEKINTYKTCMARRLKIENFKKSIAQSNYDYIIQIDGDIIMNKYFVEDHLTFSEKGLFIWF
jgi:glycosyltransferase involved in cell wall biosynthesis